MISNKFLTFHDIMYDKIIRCSDTFDIETQIYISALLSMFELMEDIRDR